MRRVGRHRRVKQKKILIIGSLSLLLFLCVGYAAFQTNLSINARGNIIELPHCEFGGKMVNTINEGDGLYFDDYEDGKCTYKGTNPNNYIIFNNESWRIISIEDSGVIKIVKNESVDIRQWHSSNNNDWETSDIKSYLNSEYLSTIMEQNKIIRHMWNIGSVITNNNDLASQINKENSIKSQDAYVGLITVSEYLRANNNKDECGTFSLNNTNRTTCLKTNWIYNIFPSQTNNLWTISPYDSDTLGIYTIDGDLGLSGTIGGDWARTSNSVVPVLYLSSEITLSGSGTEQDPYIITN